MIRVDPRLDDYSLYPEWDRSEEATRHRLMLRAEAARRRAERRERWQVFWFCVLWAAISALCIRQGWWG